MQGAPTLTNKALIINWNGSETEKLKVDTRTLYQKVLFAFKWISETKHATTRLQM